MDFALILGILGATCIVSAFILDMLRVLNRDMYTYVFINLVGSLLLVWYSILITAWPFIILNGLWVVFSVLDVIEILKEHKNFEKTGQKKI